MSVTVDTLISRSVARIGAVHPSLKEYSIELIKRCYAEGIRVQLSSGYRSFEDQARIYGQGRAVYRYKGKNYGNRDMNVVSNAEPGQSIHNYGLAIDYFLVSEDGNQSIWSVNADWKRVADIAKSMGFEWGGDWSSFRDYPHLQYTKGLSLGQIAKGMRPAFPKLNVTEVASINKPEEKEYAIDLAAALFKPSTQEGRNALLRVLKRFEGKDPALGTQWREKVENDTFTPADMLEVMVVAIDRGYITGKTE